MNANDFFHQLLPRVWNENQARAEVGVLQLTLFGARRQCFAVDLGRRLLLAAPVEQAELDLEMEDDDFRALLAGALDWEAAVAAGRIRYRGALAVLEQFAASLVPPQP